MAKASLKSEEEPDLLHPKYSENLVGHQKIEAQILQQIHEKCLPHALLLTGKKGIGKATFSYRLARFLLAPQENAISLFGDSLPSESLHVSPETATFRKIAAGSHPDLLVIEAQDIKIELARKIPEFLSLTPAEGNWRVVIIDCAEAMNRNAANALLKTLEEPPAKAVLLLVSHNPGALLPTIRSRCRKISFAALEENAFATLMARIAPEISISDYRKWALLSSCSPGVALELIIGNADSLYQELLAIIQNKDSIKIHSFADKFARKDADKAWEILKRLVLWLIARFASLGAGTTQELFVGELASLHAFNACKPAYFWTELWEKTGTLFNETDHLYLDRKQAVITLLRWF